MTAGYSLLNDTLRKKSPWGSFLNEPGLRPPVLEYI